MKLRYLLFACIVWLMGAIGCAGIQKGSLLYASQATVRVDVYENGEQVGVCSGVVVEEDKILSAQHCCVTGEVGYKDKITVIYKTDELLDLCIIITETDDIKPIHLAKDIPNKYDTIYSIGSPLGIDDIITQGRFIRIEEDYMLFSMPGFSGNSGGSIVNEYGQLVSIMVAGVPIYPQITIGVELDDIKTFLQN